MAKLQMAMFAPKTEWVPPLELPDIFSASKIAIDVETRDPNLKTLGPGWPRKDGEVVGYAIAVDGWSGYIPVRHLGGGNLDERIVNKWLKKVFESPGDKIMHNAQYDLGWIRAMGFTVHGRVIDTMAIASLLDENRYSYSLNALSYDYLNKTKSEKELTEAARSFGIDPKAEMWKMPAMYVGPYAEADAELTLELWNFFSGLLSREDLWPIANLELDLLPCLVDMTWRGIRVDTDKVERTRDFLLKKEKEVLKEIRRQTGMDVEIWAAQSLSKAFDKLGIFYPKTEKGAPSFTKNFLAENDNPVAKLIVEARNLNKMSGTFINSITRYCGSDGRIHAHINQIRSDDGGTVSGRLAMNSPNLQQTPARDPVLGPMIRSLFLPEEGDQWAAIDFSQQEPRILVHYAHVYGKSRGSELPVAADFVESYLNDPNTDFHTMTSEITGLPRKAAKTCIAEGQLVLTDKGLVPIEKITIDHLVWDGVEWVRHEGLVYQGVKEVMTYDGLTATADHEVWVGRERTLPFGVAASRLERLVRTGSGERPVRLVDNHDPKDTATGETYLRTRALRLWNRGLEGFGQLAARAVNTVQELSNQRQAQKSGSSFGHFESFVEPATEGVCHFSKVQQSQKSIFQKLWREGHSVLFPIGQIVGRSPVYASSSGGLDRLRHRPGGQQRALCGGKHTSGHEISKPSKQAKVYDIKNAGPRHRFTVSGALVHNCGLALVYGMGVNKLAEQLDVSVEEAKEVMKKFNERVPFVKGLMNGVTNRLNHPASRGSLRSILGRALRFDMWEPDTFGMHRALPYQEAVDTYGATTRLKRAYTYKALNRLIQASAADMTKKAMVDVYQSGRLPMLQVHDELAMSVKTVDEAHEIAKIMESAVPLEVPSKCDVEIGPSWGEAK